MIPTTTCEVYDAIQAGTIKFNELVSVYHASDGYIYRRGKGHYFIVDHTSARRVQMRYKGYCFMMYPEFEGAPSKLIGYKVEARYTYNNKADLQNIPEKVLQRATKHMTWLRKFFNGARIRAIMEYQAKQPLLLEVSK